MQLSKYTIYECLYQTHTSPIPNIWIVKAKIKSYSRLLLKNVGSSMRVSTVVIGFKVHLMNLYILRVGIFKLFVRRLWIFDETPIDFWIYNWK